MTCSVIQSVVSALAKKIKCYVCLTALIVLGRKPRSRRNLLNFDMSLFRIVVIMNDLYSSGQSRHQDGNSGITEAQSNKFEQQSENN